MFKWLGQVHVVFAKHLNGLVKVANTFAVAFGGITRLNWGATRIFLWLCGSPCPSSQVCLQILDKTVQFNKTPLARKEWLFSQELIGLASWETAFQKMAQRTQNYVVSLTEP